MATPDGKAASLPLWLEGTSDEYLNFGDILRSTKIPPDHPAYAWIRTRARVHRVKAMDVSRYDDQGEITHAGRSIAFSLVGKDRAPAGGLVPPLFPLRFSVLIDRLSLRLYSLSRPFRTHPSRETSRRLVAPRTKVTIRRLRRAGLTVAERCHLTLISTFKRFAHKDTRMSR